jgi:hypothetical protein
MNKRQRAEAVSGSLAMFLAFAALVYLLFGPVYSFANSTGETGTASMLQALQANAAHIQPIAIIAFSVLLLAIIGVGVGAFYHSHTHKKAWHNVLLFSAIIMVIFTLLALLSIGPLMAPATLCALVAVFLSGTKAKEVVHESGVLKD